MRQPGLKKRTDSLATRESLTGELAFPAISEVLRLPDISGAVPEVLSGQAQLSRPVRWVHVVESTNVEQLLRGHELVLTTGAGWPSADQEHVALARSFARAQAAGIVLELGTRFTKVPFAFASECRNLGLPFIVLHSSAQFVAITEAVHSSIISGQMSLLRARQEISADFADMIARGTQHARILERTGALLCAPVILQDPAGIVVDMRGYGASPANALKDLRTRPERWYRGPITAHNQLWGYLLSPISPSGADFTSADKAHRAGTDFVIDQAALALAVGRLATGEGNPWRSSRDRHIISAYVSGGIGSDRELTEFLQVTGLGLLAEGGFGLAIQPPAGAHVPLPGKVSEQMETAGLSAVVAQVKPDPEVQTHAESQLMALIAAHQSEETSTLGRAVAVVRGIWPDAKIAVGRHGSGFASLGASLREAAATLALPGGSGDTLMRGGVLHASEHQLRLLIRGMRPRPELPAYVEQVLGPILRWDEEHRGDLVHVLRAFLREPGNRTAAAASSHVSRSVFYQRLSLIEELLGADLSSGETISALYTALLAHDSFADH